MFLIHQYDENGHIQCLGQACSHEEAQAACRRAESAFTGDRYGAAYYSRHGVICGDGHGKSEPGEQLPAWERHGGVMHGREW